MKLFKILIGILVLLACFSACRKDHLAIDEKEKENPPAVAVKFEILTTGFVFDKIGDPIEAATVTLGNQITQTDRNGRFRLTGLANEKKTILTIEKDGFFSGYPTFYPEEGASQHVEVQLQERNAVGSINGSSKIVTLDQHQIDFSNASFKTSNGNTVNGAVNVFAAYLDPTDDQLENYMPGDLVGVNTAEEEQYLKSFGMLNVELEDAMGNPVQIEGEAIMTLQVPNELLSEAPSTIPLWYFDEATGNWIEEGEATLSNNQYVGTVTHFTLWNCDAPFRLVTIDGAIISDLSPESFTIRVTRPNGDFAVETLNGDLRFKGKVPADEILIFEILNNCGNVLVSETIGPFSTDQFIGTFTIPNDDITLLNISGSAVDCDLNPVSNGYVIVKNGNGQAQVIDLNADGTFSGQLSWCAGSTVHVNAYDIDTNKKSEIAAFAYSENLAVGSLFTCEDVVTGIHISGPAINKFIPATSDVTGDLAGNVHEFICEDVQGSGDKVIYQLTILSWPGNPGGPQIAISVSTLELGNPSTLYDWGSLPQNADYQVYNPVSGGLFDVRYDDIEVKVTDLATQTATTNAGHSVRIVGFFE
ncbi:MAG: carboxypeptidase-like regulatory domain-containing protein [Bacteroidota bacterium]